MHDIFIRAFKTFVQAFLGVLIPELCIILNSVNGIDFEFAPAIYIPLLCASLSAGISAIWNFFSELLKSY